MTRDLRINTVNKTSVLLTFPSIAFAGHEAPRLCD